MYKHTKRFMRIAAFRSQLERGGIPRSDANQIILAICDYDTFPGQRSRERCADAFKKYGEVSFDGGIVVLKLFHSPS